MNTHRSLMIFQIFHFVLICEFLIRITTASEELCVLQENCEKCLAADFNCAWCTDKDFDGRFRCMPKNDLINATCPIAQLIENRDEYEVLENTDTQDYQLNGKRAIQLQPQKIKLKLVKSHTQRFKMKYRPAKDDPLDLYYLMDLTWTMRDDKETLVKIGEQLSEALRTLTGNYRLGFGSFADKPIMPIISPGSESNPCAAEHDVCEPTYGYRHHLALTTDIKDFVGKVNSSQVTGNLDNLEGGFDALMQVIVCTNEIGWSENARKIVVLVTDGFMHFAGDGLLAGITQRNDKMCHLSADGMYEGTLVYDYPSLEEIYRELVRRKISVIFAVTEDVASSYYQIRDLMQEISSVEILSLDSSNILELIKKSYYGFIQKAQFQDNSPSYISITYESDCGGLFKQLKETNICNNAEMGKEFDFYINVTLTDFPTDGVYNQKIRIEEVALSEYLELDIEIQKPCPCTEEPIAGDQGRRMCNDHGIFHCGMCSCDDGWLGNFCSCDSGNYTSMKMLEDKCRQTFKNPTSQGAICSNNGECECGKCLCNLGFTGTFCECPECEDCDPERADCYCGKCVCKYGWSGNRCNYKDATERCIAPNGEICSKRGVCQYNGQCECEGDYKGRYCEIGSQENKLCVYYEPCVKCLIEQKLGQNHCENLTAICSDSEGVNVKYDFEVDDLVGPNRCLARLTTPDDIQCDHFFTYENDISSKNLKIKTTDCGPVNYAFIFGGVFAATLLAGLLTLLVYKAWVTAIDRREYARFEAEKQNTRFVMESPIYKDPVIKYTVPTYEDGEDFLNN